MYCIVEVIYGIPLNQKVYDTLEEMELEPEDVGCETLYSGSGDITPGYCGIKIGEFDEATDMALKVDSITMKPTDAQKSEAHKLIAQLPPEIKKHLNSEPDVYFVFHTS